MTIQKLLLNIVIPAKAGIQSAKHIQKELDSRLRGNDKMEK